MKPLGENEYMHRVFRDANVGNPYKHSLNEDSLYPKIRSYLKDGAKSLHRIAAYLGITTGDARALTEGMVALGIINEIAPDRYALAISA